MSFGALTFLICICLCVFILKFLCSNLKFGRQNKYVGDGGYESSIIKVRKMFGKSCIVVKEENYAVTEGEDIWKRI